MKLFTKLYDMALVWAKHRHAERYLAGMSFAESVFFSGATGCHASPYVASPTR